VLELNSLKTEKSKMLLKITDLKKELLETGLGYVASTCDIPSTSKTIFIKPPALEPPSAYVDKEKAIIGEEDSATVKPNT